MTSKDCHMRRNIFCNCRWIPCEGSIVVLSPKTFICQWHTEHLQSYFRLTAQRRACHGGQRKVLKFQTWKSVLDQSRGPCCFLSYAQMGKIQKVTNQHIAEAVALELKSLLPWIYCPQELFGLAIPLEPRAHARLVLTQVDVRDCQNY